MVHHDEGAGRVQLRVESRRYDRDLQSGRVRHSSDGHWQVPSTAQCMQCLSLGQTLGLGLGQLAEPWSMVRVASRIRLTTLMTSACSRT